MKKTCVCQVVVVPSRVKAQITMEFLLLSLVALVMISFSLMALKNVFSHAKKTYQSQTCSYYAHKVEEASYEVCTLGDGNALTIFLSRNISLSSTPTALYVRYRNATCSIKMNTHCISNIEGTYSKKVVLYNAGGVIYSK